MRTHLLACSSSTICYKPLKLKVEPLVVAGATEAAELVQVLSQFSVVVVPALLVVDTCKGGNKGLWILSDVPLLAVLSVAGPAVNLQANGDCDEGSRVDGTQLFLYWTCAKCKLKPAAGI